MNASKGKLRVLGVDDEDTVLQFLRSLFQRRGDIFDLARSGFEAVALLEAKDFDVMITDLYMPVMNGLELIRRAKELRPDMVSVILTGMGTARDSIAAIKEGVYDYIEKPIRDLDVFSLAIERAGSRARLIRERNSLMVNLQTQNVKLETHLKNLNQAYEKLMKQEEELKADLRQAQRMQQSLLPSDFPRVKGIECYGYYCPCEKLGGDFFDFIPLGEGLSAVLLADVAGHGVRAAMVTVIVRGLIHAERMLHPENKIFEAPETALAFINRALMQETLDDPLHVTMGYAVVNAAAGEIVYGSAGHPKPILCHANGHPHHVPVEGPALGLDRAPRYETVRISLNKGDFLLIYSDGLSEARNASGDELSAQRLALAAAQCGDVPANVIGERLEQIMLNHQQGAAPSDDATFVIIGRCSEREAAAGAKEQKCVKIVDVGAFRAGTPQGAAYIASGWVTNGCVIRLAGRLTWEQAPVLRTLIREAEERGADQIFVDLKDCQSLDSTLLGMFHQHRDQLILCSPPAKIIQLFLELGILDQLRISNDPAPQTELTLEEIPQPGQIEKARMILGAHESLMGAHPGNVKKFETFVELMRQDLASRVEKAKKE
ncbi:MAG: SpoIIE family protein phosphatase [Candidatus Sumerlaeota bacterium]|nr:SpoIIE family protein phosphatase [Candidatus Sumerlaeota bacterium]